MVEKRKKLHLVDQKIVLILLNKIKKRQNFQTVRYFFPNSRGHRCKSWKAIISSGHWSVVIESSSSFVSVIPNISGFESKEFKISSRVSKLFDKLLVLQWKINKLGPAFLVSLFKSLIE